jgi:hypothetical protein
MLSLNIDQVRTELRWLKKLEQEHPQRASARKPAYINEKMKS